ncbi:hypothetical protein E0J09_03535 [Rhizobium leguminosarum bv. viciae]|uniref:hypothetical protein n=1 Tax=Rhizobium leguminosarum TaxID=384 RepID=UPI00103145C0|nr:hypothetical protein [Rhizobium leguminosarum]TAX50975.1 hypothetical protein ELH99_12885 [Rhizobium leguminosarum]TCB30460.1 hypothetical protein E0J09_03535 [Rhizobium leguminosarum bv. viciae]
MKHEAKGYRAAVKTDDGGAWHEGPFSTIERAEGALRHMLLAHGESAVSWKIYPVYQGRTVPWQPVITSTAGI